MSHLSRARGVDRFFDPPLESYMPLALVGCHKKLKIPTPLLRYRSSRFYQQPSIMRCATTLIASLSMAAAMRLPAMAVPSSSLAPRMYDLRGGGKASSSSPFDMLKGRKIVIPVHESYGRGASRRDAGSMACTHRYPAGTEI